MANNRLVDDEEDILGDETRSDPEEEEGEDLFGEDMLNDYRPDPENDQYDPELLDESEQAPLTIEQRMAAERAMRARDAGLGGRRTREDPGTPGPVRLGDASDLDTPTPGAKRRRRLGGPAGSPGGDSTPGPATAFEMDPDDAEEEDLPESYYDLNHDVLEKSDLQLEPRLELKIRRSFRAFLRKFKPEGHLEPIYPDLLRKMAEEAHMHLDMHFGHLQEWSAQLALFIADDPIRILPILNETLMDEAAKKFQTYNDMKKHTGQNQLRAAIYGFPFVEKIRDLNTKAMNKLVMVEGVVTKRGRVFNQVKRLYLRCGKCNFGAGPFEVADEKDFRPGMCLECQSRGPWKVDRQHTVYQNYQRLTVQESPSSVEPGKMPRSKDVVLHGDQADSIRPGDDILLTGIYRCLHDVPTNARTNFPVFKTEIEAVHVRRKGELRVSMLTDEQQQEILDLAKSPNIRERFIASMAPSIYGMRHVKTAIALSMLGGERKEAAGKHRIRGDINTLIVGDPGLAKSQFLKYVEQTSPKAVYTTGKGASAVGLTAALTRDENGEWALEGGAMVLADDGVCLIDEFDKMNDQDRTSIHEAMEQQTISISKAGIVASLQARCSVIAVANPTEGRYDPQQTFAQNVGLTNPILSRFDMLCVLRDEADAVQDERLADHVICSHIRSHPDATADEKIVRPRLAQQGSTVEPIPQDLLRKYIQYARTFVHPKTSDLDKDKLATFYKDIRQAAFNSGGAPMTARHIESIIRIAEANAKMELRSHVTSRDLDNAIGLMLESFIQSQKYAIAEELRKKFQRYIANAVPLTETVLNLVERLFREKFETIRLSRPSALPPDVAEVALDMTDIVREIEREDIDLAEAQHFFASDRFRRLFRIEGTRLYRSA